MNQVIIVGRLGADPESRVAGSGTAVAKIRVATDSFVKGEKKTEWHQVTCFGKTAENVGQYLEKGRQVAVRGSLRTSSWEKDGIKHYRTEIIADEVRFLGGGGGGGGGGDEFTPDSIAESDMPF